MTGVLGKLLYSKLLPPAQHYSFSLTKYKLGYMLMEEVRDGQQPLIQHKS